MAAKVKALQGWCKVQCDGYRDVEVKNMTSSWKSGLAFCAIIHRYRPDLIDYDSLKKENVFENNKLAFEVADKQLSIPALLDAEDMEAMSVPDKLCIVTYVSQYYNYFRNKDKLGGPGVKGKAAPKRQMIDSKQTGTPDNKKPHTQPQSGLLTVDDPGSPASTPVRRGSSMGDLCSICQGKVYIMERHIEGSKLFHRRCLRESQRSKRTIKQNGAVSPRQARDHTSPTNQKQEPMEQDSPSVIGKENKRPYMGNGMPSKSPSPSPASTNGLLSKVHGAPKPYTSSSTVQNVTDQSKDSKISKWTSPSGKNTETGGYLGRPDKSSDEPQRKYVQNKGAQDEAKKDFFKGLMGNTKRDEPQTVKASEKSQRKYEIVGALVNNTPSENSQAQPQVVTSKPFTNGSSSPRTAKVDSGPAAKSAGDTQMLQGLLKSLAGVKSSPNSNSKPAPVGDRLNSKPTPSSTEVGHLNGPSKTAGWKKDPDSQWSGPKDSTTPLTSKVENKEDYSASRSRLKPAAQTQSHTEKDSKPISQLTDPHARYTKESTPNSVKPILRHRTESPVETDCKVTPKSILKSPAESDSEDPSRSRSISPPKSILKYSEDGKPVKMVDSKKSSSPTPPILRHVEDHKKDQKNQPKSILKSKADEGSEPVSKTILKKSQDFEERPVRTFQTPKSILKKSTEDLSELKDDSKNSSTKPILKSKDDSVPTKEESSRKSWGSKVVDLFSRPSPSDPKKKDLLSQVELDDTEEPMEVETTRPVPKPRKSILKMDEAKTKPAESKGKPNKSLWHSDIPTPEPSSNSPASSTVYSSSNHTPVSSANRNNFNAFNLADSIDLVIDKSEASEKKDGKAGQDKHTSPAKTAWQIEMEARQGIRQKEPKSSPSNFAARVEATHKLKQKDALSSQTNTGAHDVPTKSEGKPSWQMEALNRQKNWKQIDKEKANSPRGDSVSTAKVVMESVKTDSSKPAWQIEAERRQAERKGEYKDPEKFPRSKEPQMFPKVEEIKEKKTKNAMNIDKPLSPRSPPPRPVIPPNYHQASPPTKPDTSSQVKSGQKSPAPDFVCSELDIFGRTSKAEGVGKKVNRAPAFKVSPETSPRSESREETLIQSRKSNNSPEEVVTEWQKEAQRWKANRASGFVDPETKKVISPVKGFDEDSDEYFVTDSAPTPVDQNNHHSNKKRILPDTRFSFTELRFSKDGAEADVEKSQEDVESPKQTPPPRPPWIGKGFPGRPLPSPPSSVIKREVTAEPQVAQEAIITELLSIDSSLRKMEEHGKTLEQSIRMGSEEAMDEDELMIQWFELVNEKNELVRRESELMYKQKQQELEDRHTEVEYELRRLMSTPEREKTASDCVREETLLQELMETVSQRNSIVDSMEEDRKRYIEEDQEIAEVLATKDFRSGSFSKSSPPLPDGDTPHSPDKHKKKKAKKAKKKKSSGNGAVAGESVLGESVETGDGNNGINTEAKDTKKTKKKKRKDKKLTGCIEGSHWYD